MNHELLSVDTLTGLITTFADQADNRFATDLFRKYGRPLLPLGESVSWDEVQYSRHLAPVSGPESPHTQARRLGVRKRSSAMATIKVYKDLPASYLFLSRAPGQSADDAEKVLTVELEDMANLIANTKEYLASGALTGKVVVNPQKIPGSDLLFEIDFGNTEAKALKSWADPTTAIRADELPHVKKTYKDAAGHQAEIVVGSAGIEGYLVKNPDVRQLISESLGAQVLQNLPVNGISPAFERVASMRWRFVDGAYRPEGGAVERYFPDDTLVVLPGEGKLTQVLGYAEGRVHVPGAGPFAKPEAALDMIKELRGYYAYAELRTDPLGIRIYAGWCGLFVVLCPTGVMTLKVIP
jgi:hypothetical protein